MHKRSRYLQHRLAMYYHVMTGDDSSSTYIEISQLIACDPTQLKDAIQRCIVTIKDCINFGSLIPYLNKYAIFTRNEMEYFMKKYHSDSEKVINLIVWLSKKEGRGIHNFVRALKEAEEHSGHLEILLHLHKDIYLHTVGTYICLIKIVIHICII